MHTTLPCCSRYEDGEISPRKFVCWRFGTGICTPIDEIPNFKRYIQLIQDVNNANFAERYRVYWKDVRQNKSFEWLEERLQALRQHEAEVSPNSEWLIGFYVFVYCYIILSVAMYTTLKRARLWFTTITFKGYLIFFIIINAYLHFLVKNDKNLK